MSRKTPRVDYGWSNPQASDHRLAGQTVTVTTWEGQALGGSYMYKATLTLKDDALMLQSTRASSSRDDVRSTVLRSFEEALR